MARGAGSDSERTGPRDVVHVGVCSCGNELQKNHSGARRDRGGDGYLIVALAQNIQEVVLL